MNKKVIQKSYRISSLDKRGFTLVEMIVALGIFAVVALVAVGALGRIVDANRKSQSLKSAINNLNFALESISREVRVGTAYNCQKKSEYVGWSSSANGDLVNKSCSFEEASFDINGVNSNPAMLLAFKSSKISPDNPDCQLIFAYRYNDIDKTIEKAEKKRCDGSITSSSFYPITSPKVKINNFILYVSRDAKYPTAYIRLNAVTGDRKKDETALDVQTIIAPRLLQ